MNDYMFHAVMQSNLKALEGLLYALLHLPVGSIKNIELMNPIELGKNINSKTCILDLKIMLNDSKIINIEMQVSNLGDWKERSLIYLCRTFDNVEKGDDYINVTPCVHIGILDYSIDGLTPKLYSEYKMIDTKTHEIFSDKFSLYVLNLQQINDSNYEREEPDIYYWAKLFKCNDWEELKMLAKKNEYLNEVVFTLHEMTEDEKIREQCEAMERYYNDQRAAERKGRQEGRLEGQKEERALINELTRKLIDAERFDDLKRATVDNDYQEQLITELL